jgi:hypothetical protein
MQREKLYNLQTTNYKKRKQEKKRIHRLPKIISFFQGRNLTAQNFVHFENKKCHYKISVLM